MLLLAAVLEPIQLHVLQLLVQLVHEVGDHERHRTILVRVGRRDVIEVDVDSDLACKRHICRYLLYSKSYYSRNVPDVVRLLKIQVTLT